MSSPSVSGLHSASRRRSDSGSRSVPDLPKKEQKFEKDGKRADKKLESQRDAPPDRSISTREHFSNIVLLGGRDAFATVGRSGIFLANISLWNAMPGPVRAVYPYLAAGVAAGTHLYGAIRARCRVDSNPDTKLGPGASEEQSAAHAQQVARAKQMTLIGGIVAPMAGLAGSLFGYATAGPRGAQIAAMGFSNLVFGNLVRDTIATTADYLRPGSQWKPRARNPALWDSPQEAALKAKLDNYVLYATSLSYAALLYYAGVLMNALREEDRLASYIANSTEFHPAACISDAKPDVHRIYANFVGSEAIAYVAQETADIVLGGVIRTLLARLLGLEYYRPGQLAPRSLGDLSDKGIRTELGHQIIRASQMRTILGSVCGVLMQIVNFKFTAPTPDKPTIPLDPADPAGRNLNPGVVVMPDHKGYDKAGNEYSVPRYNGPVTPWLPEAPGANLCPAELAILATSNVTPELASAIEVPCVSLASLQIQFRAVGEATVEKWKGAAQVNGEMIPDFSALADQIDACARSNSSFPSNSSQPLTVAIKANQWVLEQVAQVTAALSAKTPRSSVPEPLIRLLLVPTEARGYLVKKLVGYGFIDDKYPQRAAAPGPRVAGDRVNLQVEPQGGHRRENKRGVDQGVELRNFLNDPDNDESKAGYNHGSRGRSLTPTVFHENPTGSSRSVRDRKPSDPDGIPPIPATEASGPPVAIDIVPDAGDKDSQRRAGSPDPVPASKPDSGKGDDSV